jgi:hypothetical protein
MADLVSQDERWRQPFVEQLDRLGRWVQRRVVLAAEPGDECVPAERYRDPDVLCRAVARAGQIPIGAPSKDGNSGEDDVDGEADLDLRIAVSRFTRHYVSSLSIAALVGLARGVGIDLAARRCTMVTRYNVPFVLVLSTGATEVVGCRERTSPWRLTVPTLDTVAELRRHTWGRLYGENIGPLFERITSLLGVSPKLLWANAAEWVGMVSDSAEEYLEPVEAAPFVAERRALLEAERLPGIPGPNPLRGQLEWVPVGGTGYPRAVQTRHRCCLTYLLPDRNGQLCQNCPYLPLEDRVALIRERHGVSMGSYGNGPAMRRAMELGLAKLSQRR